MEETEDEEEKNSLSRSQVAKRRRGRESYSSSRLGKWKGDPNRFLVDIKKSGNGGRDRGHK